MLPNKFLKFPYQFFLNSAQTLLSRTLKCGAPLSPFDAYVPLVTQCFAFVDFLYCFQTILSVFFFSESYFNFKDQNLYFTYITIKKLMSGHTAGRQKQNMCYLALGGTHNFFIILSLAEITCDIPDFSSTD